MLKLLVLLGCLCPVWALAVIKVACIGDSITYGYGIEDRARTYPAHLQRLLGDAYEVRNFGNSGRGIYLHSMRGDEPRGYRFMPEHKAALAWQPDIVICNLGINDSGEFGKYEPTHPNAFCEDYCKLLQDYAALPSKPQLWIWNKLLPLAPGQTFYRSADPFLIQGQLDEVATQMHARKIDMVTPFMPLYPTHLPDKIHPDAVGAEAIAQATANALMSTLPTQMNQPPLVLPAEVPADAEIWLCAGQSNMAWRLRDSSFAQEEAAFTANSQLWIWAFDTDTWTRLTPQNAGNFSSLAVSFASRRAQATGKAQVILSVAVGGAPTEAFLSESTMARYSTLLPEVTNRFPIDQNADYLPTWCAREYRARLTKESAYWATSALYDVALRRLTALRLTGILWYQGESNATQNSTPDAPLPTPYLEDTLRAIITQLRPTPETPFLMMGLPQMNRPWEPYRVAQKKICQELGAIYIDTHDLGEPTTIHPRNKVPFATRAVKALEGLGR